MLSRKQREQNARRRNIALAAVGAVVATGAFYALAIRPGMQEVQALDAMAEQIKAAPKPAAAPEPSTKPKPAPKFDDAFFIGDSITVGWHAETEAEGYRALLTKTLKSDATVSAVAGATAAEMDAVTDYPKAQDLVVIALGTNDAAQGTDPTAFRAAYRSVIAQSTDGSPDAALVCAGVWYPKSEMVTDELDATIADECEDAGGKFVPLSTMFNADGARGPAGADTWVGASDKFHPNNTGHKLIADAIVKAAR